jgi:mannose-1-phosphate guanylyltransferase/phosphomannomutase
VKAVIIAGGRGERLRPLTQDRPKPLVPVAGKPLIFYLLERLRGWGIDRVAITTGYLGERLREAVGNGAAWGLEVRYAEEPAPRGTAGGVRDLLPFLDGTFLVVSGDALCEVDVARMLAVHRGGGNVATLCLAPPESALRFGLVRTRGAQVDSFTEKPSLQRLLPGAGINTGIYMLEPAALTGVPGSGMVDFARDVFPGLLAAGHSIGAVYATTYWRDVGTLSAYREVHAEALTGSWPWPRPAGGPAMVAQSARIHGPVHLGAGTRVGEDASLEGPVFIGANCRVGSGATIRNSVLLDGSRAGTRSYVIDSVLCEGAAAPPGSVLVGAAVARSPAPVPAPSVSARLSERARRERRVPVPRR